jgi:hypothetical protein
MNYARMRAGAEGARGTLLVILGEGIAETSARLNESASAPMGYGLLHVAYGLLHVAQCLLHVA